MRDIIPLQHILKDLSKTWQLNIGKTVAHSTVFEDNNGCIDLVQTPKMRPRTKHIAIKYHHFREHVRRQTIRVKFIRSEEQLADMLTKPLPYPQFVKLRCELMGW